MTEPSDIEAQRLARTFKPQWKPVALIVGANVLMAVLLLGLPYLRGRELAQRERAHFARLSQCLLGGEISPTAGLGTPSGYQDRFAYHVLYASSDWPLRCRRPLQAMNPPDAIFLWPSIKRAGADLRAVVKLVDKELVALHRARSLGRATVPSRPLDALARLQAATTLMLRAADTTDGIDEDAVRFSGAPKLAAPARLPLNAGETALLQLSARGGVLEALALDGRGLSWLRMDSGKIDRERVKRAPLMRGMLQADDEIFAISATSPERCRERDDHCSSRATGLAHYGRGAGSLPTPTWLAGHPAGRPDRSMRLRTGGRVDMIARGAGLGDLVLKRFAIPTAVPSEEAPPLAAETSIALLDADGPSEAVWLDGTPASVAYVHADGAAIHASLVTADASRLPVALDSAPHGTPMIAACSAAGEHVIVYGTTSARRIARVDAAGAVTYPQDIVSREISHPVHDDNAALDGLKLLCGPQAAQILELDARGALWLTNCPRGERCGAATRIADQVATFAPAALPSQVLVAFSGTGSERAIRVTRWSTDGKPLGSAGVVAACFDPSAGMCGAPTLALDGTRLLLAAREGADLLVLESSDGGATFQTLSGLKVGTALDTAPHAPMQQHRVRKGVE